MKHSADTADEQTETTLYISSAKPQYLVPVHFAELFGANVQGRFWSESEAKDACVIPANILVNPKYPSNVQKNKKLDEL